MKKIIIALLAVMAAVGCANDTAKYVIKGTGLEDGAQVLLVDQITGEAIDTAVVANGAFAFQGKAPKDAYLNLTTEASDWSYPLFNDGKAIQVNYADKTLQGSDLNNKLAECDAKTDALMQEYNTFMEGLMTLSEEEMDAKEKEYDAWIEKLRDCYLGIVEENEDNLVPVAFLRNVRSLAGPDKFNELVASDAVFAKHPYVLDLKRKIDESVARQKEAEEKKQAIIGQKFLDLEEADPDGNLHKLSEYVGQGKWVLVDFWASWCGPCKAEMPNVVNAYAKYHDKGFEVVGLSFDREKEPWVEAIKEWEMPWIHLSDLKYWKTVASDVYNVNSIPDNLLIDPEGTVVARCLRGDALEAKLAEIFK
jgi:thiol-disulfide isomerase/thioredoxin